MVRAAQWHGVAPLLAHRLAALPCVPERIARQLRTYLDDNLRMNFWLLGELVKIVDLLAAQGVRALPYKGPVFALSAYGGLALRDMADLDILVGRDHVPRASDAMCGAGFQPWPEFRVGAAALAAYRRVGCVIPFQRDEDGLALELHWQPLPATHCLNIETELLWEDAASLDVGGRNLAAPSAENQILLASIHGARHAWDRLCLVCDVAQAVRTHAALDWDKLLARAHRLGAERTVHTALRLTADVLGAPLPAEVRQRLERDSPALRLAEVHRRALPAQKLCDHQRFLTAWLFFRSRERWSDRLGFLLRMAAMPNLNDFAVVGLPARLFWLYWLIRPLRLASSLAAAAWRRLRARFAAGPPRTREINP